tara:strand:- start:80 stop:1405 length:1326 start_codon:yes stop_codon:yes gene_type:complete
MATSKKELMSSARVQKQKVYRRGTVQRSAAGALNGSGRRVDKEGQASELATFLGQVMKSVPGAMDAYNKQENVDNDKRVKKGTAAYKNASPAHRKKFRDAIRSGDIEPDESPYFREGLQIAHTETLTGDYGNELFIAYENWPDKLSNDPNSFDTFVQDFNTTWETSLSSIDDGVKQDHFWPKQTALISQLASQHQQKSAKVYKDQSESTMSNSTGEAVKLDTHQETISLADGKTLDATLQEEGFKAGLLVRIQEERLRNQIHKVSTPEDKTFLLGLGVEPDKIKVMPTKKNPPHSESDVDTTHADNLLIDDGVFDFMYEVSGKQKKEGNKKVNEGKQVDSSQAHSPDPKRSSWALGSSFGGQAASQDQLVKADEFLRTNNLKANVYLVGDALHMQPKSDATEAESLKLQLELATYLDYGFATVADKKDRQQKQGYFIKGKK